MNKTQLIDALAARFEGNRKSAQHALESVIDTITREVTKGEKVAITGFGSFEKRVKAAGWARNPQTGERMRTKRKSVPKFSAGQELKNVVSGAKKLAPLPKPAKKSASATTSAAKKTAPAKRTATKAAPAKKAPATKAPAKKAPAKAAPAKAAPARTAAKKAPAKKAPAKRATKAAAPTKKTATATTTAAKKAPATKAPAKRAAKKS